MALLLEGTGTVAVAVVVGEIVEPGKVVGAGVDADLGAPAEIELA